MTLNALPFKTLIVDSMLRRVRSGKLTQSGRLIRKLCDNSESDSNRLLGETCPELLLKVEKMWSLN